MRVWYLAIWLFAASAAHAGGSDAGEIRRLTEELYAYAQRNAWSAAERTFRQLDGLEPKFTSADLFLGATAARASGDAAACQDRLLRAFQLGLASGESLDPRATEWLAEIQTNYGRVSLSSKKEGALEAVNPPFQPDRQAAIQHAARVLQSERKFQGLLPAGDYRFGKTTWTVEADMTVVQSRKLKP